MVGLGRSLDRNFRPRLRSSVISFQTVRLMRPTVLPYQPRALHPQAFAGFAVFDHRLWPVTDHDVFCGRHFQHE